MKNVCIVTPHDLIRDGLKTVLEDQTNLDIICESKSLDEAFYSLNLKSPDILFVESDNTGVINKDSLHKFIYKYEQLKIIVLCNQNTNISYFLNLSFLTIDGYIDFRQNSTEIKWAIEQIMSGEQYIYPGIKNSHETSTNQPLSDREYQVYCMLGEGKRVKEIARELSLSPKTVSTHKYRIFDKLGAENMADVIMRYLQEHSVYIPERINI